MKAGFFRCLFFLASILSGVVASHAQAEVTVTPRHLIIMRPGLDALFGSYIFAVRNDGEKKERFQGEVMLPRETVDFVPQEGVNPNEISLAASGKVTIDKFVDKGVHVLGLGFKVTSHYGRVDMSFTPSQNIGSLTILVPRDAHLEVKGPGLAEAKGEEAEDPQYKAYISGEPMVSGTTYVVKVTGIPEGRGRLWLTGGVVGLILAIAGFVLAFRTRPQIAENNAGETVLIG